MKVYILLFFLMISTNSFAQFEGVYPLAHGNLWVYTESYYAGLNKSNYGGADNLIVKDTVYGSGAPYYVTDTLHTIDSLQYYTIRVPLSSYDTIPLYYYERVRKDGYVVVYEGESDPDPNHEWVVYKKDAKIGDYWVHWGPEAGHDSIYTFVTDTARGAILNQVVTVKTLHITDSLLIDYYQEWTEKFGLVYETYEGSNYYIKGAFIDGVLYGDTTNFTTDVKETAKPLNSFRLYQNYPNPFNPTTKISWQSPVGSWQTLEVYDMLGRVVATLVDEYKPAGKYEVEFDGSHLTSGVYFYRLTAGNYGEVKKMLLLK
jgi:Secretion system C-terminal sorting domain